jgi:hypothetical protein
VHRERKLTVNHRAENVTTLAPTLTDRRSVLLACAGLAAVLLTFRSSGAQAEEARQPEGRGADAKAEQEVLTLSKDKWGWMSERKVDALEKLFHEKAVFVHMGGTMSRAQELDVIRRGSIQYRKAEIQESSARIIGTTAIVLNRIRLLAVVGGNEVTNPFVVTEVYVREGEAWKLASLSFTRTLGQ